MSNREQSLCTPLRERFEQGHYARKQILSKSSIIAWSHVSRMRLGRRLVASKAGGRLLDYGCGDGTFLAGVCDLFPHAIGVDPDARQLDDCRRRFAGLTNLGFATMADLDAPAHQGNYDVVTCMEVLEHCVDTNVDRVLDDLGRLLAREGITIISVPIEIGPVLLGKQIMRTIAGWRAFGDYKYRERYRLGELLRMVFATEQTAIQRELYPFGEGFCHMHKGFKWRSFRAQISARFNLAETHFSPLEGLGGLVSSQAWFVCKPLRPASGHKSLR
jgi:2-polyprenyl-3-methyl-5-hydroxy-6-metoxy-1,4-benzoquinol methylase